ncbi:AAA family ATPase [Micromonospora aurantiaca (nom. illeg.)]|uniref:AAA family ATPase n=1 Tax=Micromonospora aurantiaca (nom. illeg.) TaxID=47850 RepID=UPI003410588C
MKLISAHVTYYRSVADSEEFRIEQDVTCLVGKNESGKTNVLQALFRLKPIEGKAFDKVVDFPANMGRKRRELGDSKIPVVKATFRYDDDEVKQIEDDLGRGALASPEFVLTTGYGGHHLLTHSVNEMAIVSHLRSSFELPMSALKPVAAARTLRQLLTAIEALEEPTSGASAAAERIRGWRQQDVTCHLIDEYALPLMPHFVYYGDYDTMPGKVSIPNLIQKRESGTLDRGERALISLLDMAGVTLEEFRTADNHERLIRELENTSNAITEEVFEYWSQNTDLEVDLKVLQPEEGAEPPLNAGPILQVRVRNRRHGVTVPFDDRSRGFVWFFSFLAYFTKLEESTQGDLVLLLDEPGLSLHGRAQDDLLTLIDERLAPKHQVVYTTHSPFMVSAKHFERVRTVIDYIEGGTQVSEEIFKADSDTAFPLLAAMGIEMTQTLFVADDTLLVEGPSDHIYLDMLNDAMESDGRTGLDSRWVITPIGGSGKLSTFATLLGANKINVAVMVDSSTKDAQAVQRLRDNDQLAKNGLIEIKEFTGTADADIEDLFERDFYLELVNRAYAKELPAPITATDLNARDPRIVRQIEAYFRKHKIANGNFNHYKPARTYLREQASLPSLDAGTLDRVEKLFQRLNSLIRKNKRR